MSIATFFQHLLHPATQGASAAAPAQAAPSEDTDFSFDDLIDIVNPLQHLPVVSALYRAITGDQIKTPEKIAGDTLYGGLWGFVSSVADTAFQSLTGRNFGDTVLALLIGTSDSQPTGVAGASRAVATAATTPDVSALQTSLSRAGVDSETAQRAVFAYRRAYGLVSAPELAPI